MLKIDNIMADIKKVHETKEFLRVLKTAGTRINGDVLLSNDNLYSYIENGESIIRKFESELLTEDWETLLTGAKLIQYEYASDEFVEFEKNGFEYPISSGNYFSLTSSAITYYNAMLLREDSLSYPVYYPTIDGGVYTFHNSTEVDAFDVAWATALQTENLTKLSVARAAIAGVSDVGIDNDRIDDVFAIVY